MLTLLIVGILLALAMAGAVIGVDSRGGFAGAPPTDN